MSTKDVFGHHVKSCGEGDLDAILAALSFVLPVADSLW